MNHHEDKPLKVQFVAMPWPMFDAPSTSLGALRAFLSRERPEHQVACQYAYVQMWQAIEPIYERICSSPLADVVFVPLLYPEKTDVVRERFDLILTKESPRPTGPETPEQLAEYFARTQSAAASLVDQVVDRLAGRADLVGFTIAYGQLFSSLAVARKLKAKDPHCRVVFGGAGVDGECGRSVIAHYGCVDYVVQGEGEVPLLRLVDALAQQQPVPSFPGLLSTGLLSGALATASADQELAAAEKGAGCRWSNQERLDSQIADLDTLPFPDYREYAELADELNIYWHVPIESSRGCWWNRSMTADNPLRACYFCSLNIGSYREKSQARVVSEIDDLVQRHANVRLRFMDNVVRRRGLPELLDAVDELGLDLRFLAEVRASLNPYELLRLKEAGCHHVQIGVEGLSTSYLRRIGKGTTTILNLQALKTCAELELESASNLLTEFPGATEQEVAETVECIVNYAIAYQPMNLSNYRLGYGSAVYAMPEHFGISNLRSDPLWAEALPSEAAQTLCLPRHRYDCGPQVDWKPVAEAVQRWKKLKQQLPKNRTFSDRILFYTDGRQFLEIVDRRDGFRLINLEGLWREVYLYCMQVRKDRDIVARFRQHPEASQLEEILAAFVAEKLMFSERGQYLSLALAVTPDVAAERLRLQYRQEQPTTAPPPPT